MKKNLPILFITICGMLASDTSLAKISQLNANFPAKENVFIVCSEPADGIIDKKLAISVSPNPASDVITLKFQNSTKGAVTVRFADISGKTVKNLKYNLNGGASSLEIPIADLLPGMYIIQAKQNDKTGIAKLILN